MNAQELVFATLPTDHVATALGISVETGLPIEETYHALAQLYDAGQAYMVRHGGRRCWMRRQHRKGSPQ